MASVLQLACDALGMGGVQAVLQCLHLLHMMGSSRQMCQREPSTDPLLPWALMECQEWRELGVNLSILLVLRESCMIFPEEHLKNWTQMHAHAFGLMFLFITSHALFLPTEEHISAIKLVP